MSDYVAAKRFNDNGCPKCGGENQHSSDYSFRCSDCNFMFP